MEAKSEIEQLREEVDSLKTVIKDLSDTQKRIEKMHLTLVHALEKDHGAMLNQFVELHEKVNDLESARHITMSGLNEVIKKMKLVE